MPKQIREHGGESGQILVIVAVGLFAMIAMLALVVDGGHAWGQQRDAQNGSDAISEAGAIKLAENLPYKAAGQALPNQNGDVAAAVNAMALANAIDLDEAWYTDFAGTTRVGTGPVVGPNALPAASDPPAGAAGVEAVGSKEFDTFIGSFLGFDKMTAHANATAIAGYVETIASGNTLPVTFPVNLLTCSNNNRPVTSGNPWPLNVDVTVPLCAGDPGNVGWLDWTPPNGGVSELVNAIQHPELVSPEISTPEWYFVSQTGNVSSANVQNALMEYANDPDDQAVYIPLFDATCSTDPPGVLANACTTGPGNGQNQYYHFAGWASFDIEWIDLNGGSGRCGSGNGSTGCFFGQFRGVFGMPSGTLRAGTDHESPLALVGIQLAK
jgi:Flp pilus assembly protein TadG